MKYFTVILIAFAFAFAVPTTNAANGSILGGLVNNLLTTVFIYLKNLILLLIPPNTPVQSQLFVQYLAQTQPLTIGTLVNTAFAVVGIDASPVLNACKDLFSPGLDPNNAVQFFQSSLGGQVVPFETYFDALLNYLLPVFDQLVPPILLRILPKLLPDLLPILSNVLHQVLPKLKQILPIILPGLLKVLAKLFLKN